MSDIEKILLKRFLDEDIVTKAEMIEAINTNNEKIVNDIKKGNRWAVSAIVSILSIVIAVVSLVLHKF